MKNLLLILAMTVALTATEAYAVNNAWDSSSSTSSHSNQDNAKKHKSQHTQLKTKKSTGAACTTPEEQLTSACSKNITPTSR